MASSDGEGGGGVEGRMNGASISAEGVTRRRIPLSPPRVLANTKAVLEKQAKKMKEKAEQHEHFFNKVTYYLGVVTFGVFCFLLGSRPQQIPLLYCAFLFVALPLRWVYYRSKKWHYFLLDFCYYANMIFISTLLFFPRNERLFMISFSFAEGPLAWAIIVWRCSLVFSSLDKITSVLIHLLPGTVLFIIRWWDPVTYSPHSAGETGPWPAWPAESGAGALWTWLFLVPLLVYSVWQLLYWAIVHGLRNQRILNDPAVMTSFRELSRKAERANNFLWQWSGLLGPDYRFVMYSMYQAIFTVATTALTVPMFQHYRLHLFFQVFKASAAIWNGGNFFFDVMPTQVIQKKDKGPASKGDALERQKSVDAATLTDDQGVAPGVEGGVASSSNGNKALDGGSELRSEGSGSGTLASSKADGCASVGGEGGESAALTNTLCAMCKQHAVQSVRLPEGDSKTVAAQCTETHQSVSTDKSFDTVISSKEGHHVEDGGERDESFLSGNLGEASLSRGVDAMRLQGCGLGNHTSALDVDNWHQTACAS